MFGLYTHEYNILSTNCIDCTVQSEQATVRWLYSLNIIQQQKKTSYIRLVLIVLRKSYIELILVQSACSTLAPI